MGHVFVVSNMFDYGMDPQEAIDFPRVFVEGDSVSVEESVPAAVVAGLEPLGHGAAPRGAVGRWAGRGGRSEVRRADGSLGPPQGRMALGYY